MFSSYTAEQIARTYKLADVHKVNLLGAVTWAFEFEDQPYFDGFRDLATNGIDKPVLNMFRMLGQMSGDRVAVGAARGLPLDDDARQRRARRAGHLRAGGRDSARRDVLSGTITTTICRRRRRTIELTIDGLADGRATLTHYRVDGDHSNAYRRGSRWARRSSRPPRSMRNSKRPAAPDCSDRRSACASSNGRAA